MRFLIFDLNNLVQRARYGKDMRGASKEDFAGMCLHIALDSFQFLYHKFEPGHVVAAVDSSSWRYELYPEYKSNREKDEFSEITKDLINDLADYLQAKTNVTVLRASKVEADDFIARWVQLHRGPEFENIIISGDYDFKQLVRGNTELYTPNIYHLFTPNGVFMDDGKRILSTDLIANRYGHDWKVITGTDGEPLGFDPDWELFLKCIRGDTSDKIPTAFPRVQEKKLRKAYADRGGLEWNNLINSRWGEDGCNSVRDRYEFNRSLIDLTLIPDRVLNQMDEVIGEELLKTPRTMIPIHFRKYCERHQLIRIVERVNSFSRMLSTRYPLEQIENEVQGSSVSGRSPTRGDHGGGDFFGARA